MHFSRNTEKHCGNSIKKDFIGAISIQAPDIYKIQICNTQICWVSGLCPSSGNLKTRKHNVSESG
jgi:hypothetical protein